MSVQLAVKIGKIHLKNPVMTASGTFGCGEEYAEFFDLNRLGGIITKTITLNGGAGNPPPRIVETPSGILNSIGLQNDGVEAFVREKSLFLRKLKTSVIVSIAGHSAHDYGELARRLDGLNFISGLEINVSCPNVQGGLEFSAKPASLFKVVSEVRNNTEKTLIAKLSPNAGDITEVAKAAEDAGADAVSLVNTFKGMAVDIEKQLEARRLKIEGRALSPSSQLPTPRHYFLGGLSGPAIKPIALRMVWEVFNKVKIPVIGIGGIISYKDALEFIIAGAGAVQIGTANFLNPNSPVEIITGIEEYARRNNIKDIKELIGCLKI